MGDFNGQIGAKRPGENVILGQFSYSNKTRSRNGEKITNFALENNLKYYVQEEPREHVDLDLARW